MRVLFERALTSEALTPEQTVEIWNKFLEFETNVGDLPGIKKVEKRRSQAFDLADTLKSCPTARLIDRYRFNDLFPCSRDELTSMGYEYPDLFDTLNNTAASNVTGIGGTAGSAGSLPNSSGASLQSGVVGTVTNGTNKAISADTKMATPDISQMVPFKPKFKWIVGEHRLPGGGFPLPPSALHSEFSGLLSSYNGKCFPKGSCNFPLLVLPTYRLAKP